jgi:cobalamin biosynthesis Mg chelatase CobN
LLIVFVHAFQVSAVEEAEKAEKQQQALMRKQDPESDVKSDVSSSSSSSSSSAAAAASSSSEASSSSALYSTDVASASSSSALSPKSAPPPVGGSASLSLNPARSDASDSAVEWAHELEVARQPGKHMGAIHLLALAHVLRRPIIVYGEHTVGPDYAKQGIV